MTSPLDHLLERLPHQPPMRWLRGVRRTDTGETVCELYFPEASFFGEDEAIPSCFGLEMLAQASAVHLAARQSAAQRQGRLVRCRRLVLHRPFLPIKTTLLARVIPESEGDGPLHLFHGTVETADGLCYLEGDWAILTDDSAR